MIPKTEMNKPRITDLGTFCPLSPDNSDVKIGLDISEFDEFQNILDTGLSNTTFESDYINQTNLYIDANGRLYFAP